MKFSTQAFTKLFAVVLAIGVSAMNANADIKVGGFADAQLMWKNDSNGTRFSLADGALYLTNEIENVKVMVDVPFSHVPGAGTKFATGSDKFQAWAEYKHSSGFRWKMGQFDTIFGFEVNDNIDNAFTHQGLLYSQVPVTHLGLLVGYDLGKELGINLIINNGRDLALSTNAEFGGQVFFRPEGFRLVAGTYLQDIGGTINYTMDFLAGMDFGPLAVDVEFLLSTGSKIGVLGHFAYKLDDTTSAGLRAEYLTLATGTGTLGVAVGPTMQVTKNLKCRIDYGMTAAMATGASATLGHQLTLSKIFSL